MSDHSESFRNELVSKLFDLMPQDHLLNFLSVFDSTVSSYEISRRPLALAPASGVPEVVKYFIASKAVENLSAGTLKIYRLRLIDFFTMVRKSFQDVNANDIRMYLYYYKTQRKSSDSYTDNIRRILNSFFTWLVNNEYLLRNPCSNIEKIRYQPKERVPLSPYDLEVLRWNCNCVREKALIDFFFSTGVRLSECHDVNRQDIDWENRSVIIRHGKGNKRRTVFFNAESELSLRKYLESRTDNNDALFVTIRRPHNRLCQRGLQNIITNVSRRTGLHVYPHKLRHTFATSGLHGGMSLEKLQSLMGHSKPETTMIYAKLDNDDLQREHQRIFA